jgi:hypothetical protein
MPRASAATAQSKSPESQLEQFIDRFSPEVAAQTRAVLKKIRERVPGAVQMVYDNYNALVIGFKALMKAAIENASQPLDRKQPRRILIASASPNRRARRVQPCSRETGYR